MAAAPDTEILLYNQIWTLLENDPDWAALFSPGNRIKLNAVSGTQTPRKTSTADGDYPQAMLDIVSGTTSLFLEDETFGTYSDSPPAHWLEKSSFVYRLIVKSQKLKLGEATNLGSISRATIRAGGPRLGAYPGVSSLKLRWETTETDQDDEDRTRRIKTTIDIVVEIQVDGSTLKGT